MLMKKVNLVIFALNLSVVNIIAQETPAPAWITKKIYINPQFSGLENGTIDAPFKSTRSAGFVWSPATAYLFKRNTVTNDTVQKSIAINKDSVVVGAYGDGKNPILNMLVKNTGIDVTGNNCTINDLELHVPVDLSSHGIGMSGDYGQINRCIIVGGNSGIRGTGVKHLKILNSDISGCIYDGIYISPSDTVTISKCYVHDQIVLPSLENQGSIDNVHIYSSKMVYVDSLQSDHSNFPGKFCLILTGVDSASIKNSVFVGHSENASIYSAVNNSCSYQNCYFERGQYGIWGFGSQWVTNCIFRGQDDNAIFGAKYLYVKNCSFLNQKYSINKFSAGMIKEIKNCIFYDFIGTLQTVESLVDASSFTNNCMFSEKPGRTNNYYKGAQVLLEDPMFINVLNNNFRLSSTSPCIDKGLTTSGIETDITGAPRIQGSKIDYGAYEYTPGLPVVYNVVSDGIGCEADSSSISLQNSEQNVEYKLFRNEVFTGKSLKGNGSELNFGKQKLVGFYSILAQKTGTSLTNRMNGNLPVLIYPLPKKQYLLGGGFYDPISGWTPITLSSSESDVSYQLYLNNSKFGAPLIGDGDSLNFGVQTQHGKYTAIATNIGTGCSNKMPNYVVVSNPMGISEFAVQDCKIIPNPSSGDFILDLGKQSADFNNVCLYNLSGQLVYRKELVEGVSSIPITIAVPSGEYNILLSGIKGKSMTLKLIIR